MTAYWSCFNPCFSGYLCSGNGRCMSFISYMYVSILVFLDTSVPGWIVGPVVLDSIGFQSLFFWIPLFRDGRTPFFAAKTECFNPCFSGYLCSGFLVFE